MLCGTSEAVERFVSHSASAIEVINTIVQRPLFLLEPASDYQIHTVTYCCGINFRRLIQSGILPCPASDFYMNIDRQFHLERVQK